MDGEQEMSIEIHGGLAVILVQQLMFVGFLNLFFDVGKNKLKNVLSFIIAVGVLFVVGSYFTFSKPEYIYLKCVLLTAILVVYTLCFLKGSVYLKILIPIVIIGINMVLANLSLSIVMHFNEMPMVGTVNFPDTFEYLYLVISNIVFALLLFNLLYISKKQIQLSNISEVIIFICLAIVIYIAALSDMVLYEVSGFDAEILPYVIIIFVSVFSLTGMFWHLILKVSRDAKLKTELLLSTQREEMYKNSVMNTNEQIENLSQLKHDMKNQIMSVNTLISDKEYERAGKLCESLYEKLRVPVLSFCKNPVLNAIINVGTEKATRNKVDFTYEVDHTLDFVEDSDIVSLVGNLCDNAVEYLCTIDESKRRMNLTISSYKGYCYITCKNTIDESVLKSNPTLTTTKKNTYEHGKGMKILSNIAKKYDGEVLYKEQENEFSVSVIIRKKK